MQQLFRRCLHCKQGGELKRVLPAMMFFIHPDCIEDANITIIRLEQIENLSRAPWTADQLSSLEQYQKSETFSPFVCSVDHVFEIGNSMLICRECEYPNLPPSAYGQDWAYVWTVDWSWKQLERQ